MENKKGKICPEPIVGALIINSDGEVLLAKSKKWQGQYTVIGGHVEIGETMEEAIKREIREEAGIDVEVISKIGFLESIFDKNFNQKKHFIFLDFLCRYDGEKDSIKLNDEFENEYMWITPEKALDSVGISVGTKRIIEEYLEYQKKEDYLGGWKRCQADFENYKKRQKENQKEMIAYSNLNLISEILPVVDNFYASTEHVPEEQKDNQWVVGIMHIQRQLENVLNSHGVSEIAIKKGDNFDTRIMEAIENKECPPEECKNAVKKVVVRGYRMGEKVVRPAKVIIE